ncbi:MAG: hypothetical protein ACM3X3_03150 [Betaproteobacteria bacterium]
MAREIVIASFIVRFVRLGGSEAGDTPCSRTLRISVKNIQSGYERRFARMDEAVEFIREEIDLLEQE